MYVHLADSSYLLVTGVTRCFLCRLLFQMHDRDVLFSHIMNAVIFIFISISISPSDFLFLLQFFEAHCLREVLCCKKTKVSNSFLCDIYIISSSSAAKVCGNIQSRTNFLTAAKFIEILWLNLFELNPEVSLLFFFLNHSD